MMAMNQHNEYEEFRQLLFQEVTLAQEMTKIIKELNGAKEMIGEAVGVLRVVSQNTAGLDVHTKVLDSLDKYETSYDSERLTALVGELSDLRVKVFTIKKQLRIMRDQGKITMKY